MNHPSNEAQVLAFPQLDPREAEARRHAERLAAVLDDIRVDAQARAPHYRDDTVVPGGGE